MRYLSLNKKSLVVNEEIFEYTNKIKIMSEKDEICIFTKGITPYSFELDFKKGHVLKMYLFINDDWLFFEKIIFNYESISASQEMINGYLIDRRKIIKEVWEYGIEIRKN